MGNLPTVQASLAYGFARTVKQACSIFLQSRQRKMTTSQSAFGAMGVWYGSKMGLYVANVDGYTKRGESEVERDDKT